MSDLQELKFDSTRGKVITTRGDELIVKEHRGWKYVNYNGKKIGISSLPELRITNDVVFEYVFGGLFIQFPCPAMDYWIMRHRMKRKISITDFKKNYLLKN